jgi:hypothetical protein
MTYRMRYEKVCACGDTITSQVIVATLPAARFDHQQFMDRLVEAAQYQRHGALGESMQDATKRVEQCKRDHCDRCFAQIEWKSTQVHEGQR